jgi:cytoskeletal protein CcmA (bactofilin family)
MFSNGKRRTNKIDTLVGRTTKVAGDLHFDGGLHVDGAVNGNIIAIDGSHSVLEVSDNGIVEGEVRCPHIVLDGTVVGDVHATERVELGAGARVEGNLYYYMLEMAAGAEVNGKLVRRVPDDTKLLSHKKTGSGVSGETS